MTTNKPSSGREGGRSLKTRVKSAGKRSMSSALWLGRQLNDPYVARAKSEGYRSRAAFRLLEMDDQPRRGAGRRGRRSGRWRPRAAARSWASTSSRWSPCPASTSP